MNVVVEEHELKYHTHISAPAYGDDNGIIMEQDCFFLHRKITPKASAEIGELKYFTLNEYLSELTKAPGAVMILEKLKDEGLID